MESKFDRERREMVEEQIQRRGIHDPAVLKAMLEVPRHSFVPEGVSHYAYVDSPLSIGFGQTISQPYIVALMTQAAELAPDSVCLDIGTGSGYAAAVLSKIASKVYSVERIPELAEKAEEKFKELGYTNIHVKTSNGTLGWPEKGPYDAILVTAGAPFVPESYASQLKTNGRIIIPVGDVLGQELLRLRKTPAGTLTKELIEYVRFVPLIGEQGWNS